MIFSAAAGLIMNRTPSALNAISVYRSVLGRLFYFYLIIIYPTYCLVLKEKQKSVSHDSREGRLRHKISDDHESVPG